MILTKIKTTTLICALVLSVGGLVPTGQASASPAIKDWSSKGGNPQNKTGSKDRVYLVKAGDKITFTVKADGVQEYQWRVNKEVQKDANGKSFQWTVPVQNGIWKIHVRVTNKVLEQQMADLLADWKKTQATRINCPPGTGYPSQAGQQWKDQLYPSDTQQEWIVSTFLKKVTPGQSIQAAIDSVPAEGGIVELAKGAFEVNVKTAPIQIRRSNIALVGQGRDKTVLKVNADLGQWRSLIRIYAGDLTSWKKEVGEIGRGKYRKLKDCGISNVIVKDLHIHGAAYKVDYNYANTALDAGMARDLTFSGLRIDNFGFALNPLNCYYVLIADNNVENVGIITDTNYFCCTWSGNVMRRIHHGGVCLKSNGGCYRNVYINNTLGPARGSDLLHLYMVSDNNLIARNTFTGGGISAIKVINTYGTIIRDNVIFDGRGRGGKGIWICKSPSGNTWRTHNAIKGNLIYNNESDGITVDEMTTLEQGIVTITGNTIYGNGGNGISAVYAPDFVISNNIIANNTGYGILMNKGKLAASYNGLWKNAKGNYKGCNTGAGDISKDPLFADPAGGDFHLKSKTGRWNPKRKKWVKDNVTSPCIDAGNPKSKYNNERPPNGGRINIGAYGNTIEASKSMKE